MNPHTAEIHEIPDDIYREATKRGQNVIFDREELIPLQQGLVTPEEIEQGFANFNTWAEALGLNLNTRQVRRKAERRYAKILKKV